MRIVNLAPVWAATPVKRVTDGVAQGGYTNLRRFTANLQSDHDEADLAVYGETVQEIIKLRTATPPEVAKFDHLYLSEPAQRGTIERDGGQLPDYGEGDYEVRSVSPAAVGVALARNPTVITAKRIHKSEG